MKTKFILWVISPLLVAMLIILSFRAEAIEQDKFLHFGASMAIAGSVMYVTEDWRYSLGACMAVGLAKELYDEYDYGGFDGKDLAADALGCVAGYYLVDYGLKLEAGKDSVAINYEVKF